MHNVKNLSIIVPVYNEEKVILEFHKRLSAALDKIDLFAEIIYVNDGSQDNSLPILHHLQTCDGRIHLIDFSCNFGKKYAMTAGINKSVGEVVILIHSDLEDQPERIALMLEKWRNGYDVVLMKRACYGGTRLNKTVMKFISRIYKRKNIVDFRLMSRQVVNALHHCPEEVRFMRSLFVWLGFKTVIIE